MQIVSASSVCFSFLFRGIASLILGMVLLSLPAVAVDEDFAAIHAAVFDYFEGVNSSSSERLLRAFDDSASLKSVDRSGSLIVEPIAHAISRWIKASPKPRRGKILSIDLAVGPIAKVVFDFDGRYVDYLTLAKLRGQWKIIDKVFVQTEPSLEQSVQ